MNWKTFEIYKTRKGFRLEMYDMARATRKRYFRKIEKARNYCKRLGLFRVNGQKGVIEAWINI